MMTRLERMFAAHAVNTEAYLPSELAPVWNAFVALSNARRFGPTGPEAIGYVEIKAYMEVMRMPLEPHHIIAIKAADNAWLKNLSGDANLDAKPITPEVFDALV